MDRPHSMTVTFRDNSINKLLLDFAPEGFGDMGEVDDFVKEYKQKVVAMFM